MKSNLTFLALIVAGGLVGLVSGNHLESHGSAFSVAGLLVGATLAGASLYRKTKDAELLVSLYTLAQTPRVARSFLWYYSHFDNHKSPDDVDYETFIEENPRGSEGYFTWTAIASFFETAGVLVRTGRISEGLIMERWPVDWYWRYLKPLVQFDRDRGKGCDTAYYADNFEWLAGRMSAARKAGRLKARWESGRSSHYES